jgi:hypothetical protein
MVAVFGAASADGSAAAEPTLSGSVDEVQGWLDAHRTPTACSEHCFVLSRLVLRGDAKARALRFELSGSLLTPGPFDVPLFGDPSNVRVTNARLNGSPAVLGFEGDHWFVHTTAPQFVLTGALAIDGDSLHVTGPVNVVDAALTGGHVAEGDHLSGVAEAILHVEVGEAATDPNATTETFELARAIRVADRTTFEYRVHMSAGHDLGTRKLPLKNGEEISGVDGAAAWKVEEGELVLTTSGREAQVTIRGVLPDLGTFMPDARSASEWMLVESDIDHEVKADGDAMPADAAGSPIPASAASVRAFRLMPGQRLALHAERRTSHDVLAAVVDYHSRTAVLTSEGDLVMADTFGYDNSALDVVRLHTHARPIFLAVDGAAERMLHEVKPGAEGAGSGERGGDEVAVPLRAGHHSVRLESLSHADIAWLGGRLRVPMPDQALSISRASVRVGLPDHVYPVMTTGGGGMKLLVGNLRDALAFVASWLVAWLAFGRWKSRVAATASAFGLYWASSGVFVVGLALFLAVVGAKWAASRFAQRAPGEQGTRWGWQRRVALGTSIVVVGGAMMYLLRNGHSPADSTNLLPVSAQVEAGDAPLATWGHDDRSGASGPTVVDALGQAESGVAFGMIGLAQHASLARQAVLGEGSFQKGVTPVELPMPGASRFVEITRELVTQDRPFAPVVWYVTDGIRWVLGIGWLLAIAWLAWSYRVSLGRARESLRRLFEAPVTAEPAPPSVPFR